VDVGLAYVLCQPFPTYAVIYHRRHEQLMTSLPSLELTLSGAELQRLDGS
jgi:aryl-alcohol dehydrogenase-like predicted oxidoreductase